MGDSVKKLAEEQAKKAAASIVQKNVPAALQSAVPSISNLMPGNSGRIDPAAEAASLGMSLDQYNNLSTEELNRLKGGSSSGGFLDSIGNFFKGSPDIRSGEDQYAAEQAAKLEQLRSGESDYAAQLSRNAGLDSVKDMFGGVLKKVASPYGAAAANIGASLIGQNQAQKGVDQQLGAYDQALAKVQDAQQISGDAFNALSDNPEQLAMRAQAMKGLSDRAAMGLTPEDQAELQKINRQSAQQFKANNATIGQDMARRGMANSGLGLAQSMGAADQALQNQALAGQNQAAQSFAAKQGALNNLAGASNTALQSDYTRQLGKATNLSAVNQFNAQQRAAANTNAANTMINKGEIQAGAAANKGKATGAIGQVVGGLLNPADKKA